MSLLRWREEERGGGGGTLPAEGIGRGLLQQKILLIHPVLLKLVVFLMKYYFKCVIKRVSLQSFFYGSSLCICGKERRLRRRELHVEKNIFSLFFFFLYTPIFLSTLCVSFILCLSLFLEWQPCHSSVMVHCSSMAIYLGFCQ